jgi:predicted site-specific integrase-resolvase
MYVKPKEASKYFNVSENALRQWANQGKIKYNTTNGGHRRYFIENEGETRENPEIERIKIIYARVSSAKQKDDLTRQSEYLRTKYPTYTLIIDIGSGINFERTGFKRILEGLFKGTIQEVVVAHKDRFTRFGFSLFEWIFSQHNSKLLYVEEQQKSNEQELSDDLMAIITVFSAKYYGQRKYKNRSTTIL